MIERIFYWLPELAERWECTVHDLLQLGMQDRAQVCVNIYGMADGISRTRIQDEDSGASSEDLLLTDIKRREMKAYDAALKLWVGRITRDMPAGVFEIGYDDLRFLEMPDAVFYELHEALKFEGGWWKCSFDPPVIIKVDHLCMLNEEVQRLDSEVFCSAVQVADVEENKSALPVEAEIDPSAYPPELDIANIAFRAVTNGYGDKAATFRNRLVQYLKENHLGLKNEAVERIATIANPDKDPGRKGGRG
jgi:hypothetical protein